jgi:hypothetical protein
MNIFEPPFVLHLHLFSATLNPVQVGLGKKA